MYEIDGTFLAYELAYRTERLTGHRDDEHPQHAPRRRGAGGRRRLGGSLGRTRRG